MLMLESLILFFIYFLTKLQESKAMTSLSEIRNHLWTRMTY